MSCSPRVHTSPSPNLPKEASCVEMETSASDSATHTWFSSKLKNKRFVTVTCSRICSQDGYGHLGQEFETTVFPSPDQSIQINREWGSHAKPLSLTSSQVSAPPDNYFLSIQIPSSWDLARPI